MSLTHEQLVWERLRERSFAPGCLFNKPPIMPSGPTHYCGLDWSTGCSLSRPFSGRNPVSLDSLDIFRPKPKATASYHLQSNHPHMLPPAKEEPSPPAPKPRQSAKEAISELFFALSWLLFHMAFVGVYLLVEKAWALIRITCELLFSFSAWLLQVAFIAITISIDKFWKFLEPLCRPLALWIWDWYLVLKERFWNQDLVAVVVFVMLVVLFEPESPAAKVVEPPRYAKPTYIVQWGVERKRF